MLSVLSVNGNMTGVSTAQWIAHQRAARTGLDREDAMRRARSVFHADLYRAAFPESGADLPGASSKIEGTIETETPVASGSGKLFLACNVFFDRRVFDPDAPPG